MAKRVSTIEEYKREMNLVSEYINNHLSELIDLAKLANLTHFSPYHFHRIARAFLGEPIGAYIVRMRLETAAKLLRYTDMPVVEIAERVGYNMPSSLSKAFKLQYNITPIDYRNNKNYVIMKTFETEIDLAIRKMKIVEVPQREVIYIKQKGEYKELDFAGAWGALWGCIKEQNLFTAGIEHIAIYHDDPHVTEADKLRTDICLVVHKKAKPKGAIGVKTLAGGKFALFHYQGSYQNLDAVYNTIYAKLLPESELKLRDDDVFEKYLNNPGETAPERLETDIYIPIE